MKSSFSYGLLNVVGLTHNEQMYSFKIFRDPALLLLTFFPITACDRVLDAPATLRRGTACIAEGRWRKELMRVSPDQERAEI